MVYNSGQLANIYRFVYGNPEWFILGGPGDGDEAQCAVKQWPGINVVAVEACTEMRQWQLKHGFPDGLLLGYALSDGRGWAQLKVDPDNYHNSTMVMDRAGNTLNQPVCMITLDELSQRYGPFANAILWLDIEGMEYRALLGAENLLKRKAFMLINVEIMLDEEETKGRNIRELLTGYGYVKADHWDRQSGNHYDEIYVL